MSVLLKIIYVPVVFRVAKITPGAATQLKFSLYQKSAIQ